MLEQSSKPSKSFMAPPHPGLQVPLAACCRLPAVGGGSVASSGVAAHPRPREPFHHNRSRTCTE
eukprot:1244321-Alexandrium_andersonii.AAC.1